MKMGMDSKGFRVLRVFSVWSPSCGDSPRRATLAVFGYLEQKPRITEFPLNRELICLGEI